MTDVVIPLVLDGNGDVVPATVSVALVDSDDRPVVGFVGADMATEYQELSLKQAAVTIPLQPQASIELPGGGTTQYRVTIATAHRKQSFPITVPDEVDPQDLYDLVDFGA